MQDHPAPATQKSKKQLTWALICLIGPTALIVITVLLYAIVNFITGTTAQPTSADGALFTEPSPVHTISNVILFVIGAISVATWLPGIIAGIILLVTRK